MIDVMALTDANKFWCIVTDVYTNNDGEHVGEWEVRSGNREVGSFSLYLGPWPDGTATRDKHAGVAIDIIEALDGLNFRPVFPPALFDGENIIFEVVPFLPEGVVES